MSNGVYVVFVTDESGTFPLKFFHNAAAAQESATNVRNLLRQRYYVSVDKVSVLDFPLSPKEARSVIVDEMGTTAIAPAQPIAMLI